MIIDAMLFHIFWMVMLYIALTVLRAPVAWGIDTKSGLIRRLSIYEPKISANLSNQFEWPMLFYCCGILAISVGVKDNDLIMLAWLFIGGRIIHTAVHVFTNNIRLRGAVFTINFLAVLLMWLRLYFVLRV